MREVITQNPIYEGPRAPLSLVLKVLAGDGCGIVKIHLDKTRYPGLQGRNALDAALADPRNLPLAEDSMVAMMRNLADLWINSGKSGEGATRVDNPSHRHVSYEPPQDVPPIFVRIGRDGSSSFLLPTDIPIETLFYLFIGTESSRPELHEDGKQSPKELIFGFPIQHLSDGSDGNALSAFHDFGKKVAMYWFARLLNSPYSRHLAHCDNCRAYFAYERAPRVDRKNNIYCSNCKSQGDARRAEKSRDNKRKAMIADAADAWIRWKPSHRWPERKPYVLHAINQKHGTDWKKNWITSHFDEILKQVAEKDGTR